MHVLQTRHIIKGQERKGGTGSALILYRDCFKAYIKNPFCIHLIIPQTVTEREIVFGVYVLG